MNTGDVTRAQMTFFDRTEIKQYSFAEAQPSGGG